MTDKIRSSENRKMIAFTSVIAVIAFARILLNPLGDLDELWNYDMSRAVVLGYIPYRDYNRVQTPLFALINALPLLIRMSLMTYRITCAVILTVMMTLLHKAVSKDSCGGFAMVLVTLCMIFTYTVTYNTLFLLFALGVYLLLIRPSTDKRNLLAGALCVCAALSRQTSGGFLLLFVLVIIAVSKDGNRTRGILMYLTGAFIPCLIFLGYLLVTDSFYDFWRCCLFSLFAFGGEASAFQLSSVPFLEIAAAGIICDIVLIRRRDKNAAVHLCLGIPVLLTVLPIFDDAHSYIAALWFLIPVSQLLWKGFKRFFTNVVMMASACAFAAVSLFIAFAGVQGYEMTADHPELTGVYADPVIVAGYRDIALINDEYEDEGYNVELISFNAVMISVIGDGEVSKFYPSTYYSVGVSDPLEYITAACADEGTVIMMPDDYETEGWQNPSGVCGYVKDHCESERTIYQFSWYK